ncbi:hypothetical protein BJ166DRAFT_499052 [Pestalotiopsis sp. NC0098]|nr:hypothetical protein BJ166DRAFT_499052 [Pestalotiopsis sp. NC0098]
MLNMFNSPETPGIGGGEPDPRPADMSPPLINATSVAPGHVGVIITEKTTALISDRGLDTKLLMTTAYHPQANCMDERKNQTVEIAMRFRNLTQPESNWLDVDKVNEDLDDASLRSTREENGFDIYEEIDEEFLPERLSRVIGMPAPGESFEFRDVQDLVRYRFSDIGEDFLTDDFFTPEEREVVLEATMIAGRIGVERMQDFDLVVWVEDRRAETP